MDKNNIFRFNVSVDDSMFVHVAEAFDNLPGKNGNWVFMKLWFFLHQVVKLTVTAEFHQQIHIVIVTEVSVEFDQIGVVKKHLDLNLSYHLVNHLVFLSHFQTLDIILSDDFHSWDKSAFKVPK